MVIYILVLLIISVSFYYINKQKKISNLQGYIIKKNDQIINVFYRWMNKKQKGKTIADFLKVNGYHTVAIYGLGFLGKSLYYELLDTDIKIKYAVDKNKNIEVEGLKIYNKLEKLENVDVIIVTALLACEMVEKEWADNLPGIIISLEDIVDEM